MEQNLPKNITNERDLELYERYLKNDRLTETGRTNPRYPTQIENRRNTVQARREPESLENPTFFQGYLKKHIGKLIKAESLLGNRLESRMGILLEVGADFLVIKSMRNSVSVIIDLKNVKYVTVVHDNDIEKTGLF